jgi:hypothetical protein
MISKQTVFLSSDRSCAVAEGDEDAKFLLVREGHEIEPEIAEQYEGAVDLIGKAAAAKPAAEQKKVPVAAPPQEIGQVQEIISLSKQIPP